MKVTQEQAVWWPNTDTAYHSITAKGFSSEYEVARHHYKQGILEINPEFAYLLPAILQAVANSKSSSRVFNIVAHNILWSRF